MVSFPVFINICVTENGCKVDITRKNIYNYCNVNLTFGGTMKNRIKELREQRGLTQEQLGELVGASRQAINAIETEKFEIQKSNFIDNIKIEENVKNVNQY